jgi:hypothetical protein
MRWSGKENCTVLVDRLVGTVAAALKLCSVLVRDTGFEARLAGGLAQACLTSSVVS